MLASNKTGGRTGSCTRVPSTRGFLLYQIIQSPNPDYPVVITLWILYALTLSIF
jgi:hypothetical protein